MTVRILIGDVRARLRELPNESVHCVVTSPPYWGLRDYGVAGQLGLEPTLGEHLRVMVEEVFAEVWRVLRKDGTCWVNYGDCYATSPNGRSAAATKAAGNDDRTFRDKPFSTIGGVLKPKDLVMLPNRFAIAMQDAGWWVRSENIWHKPNPMPDSAQDRTSPAHEKVWHFTKSQRYWYDAAAVRTPLAEKTLTTFETEREQNGGGELVKADNWSRDVKTRKPKVWKMPDGWNTGDGAHGSFHPDGREKGKKADKQRGHSRRHAGFNDRWDEMEKSGQMATGANLRNVWTIATRAFPDAHFATFPPEIPEICIKAGCPIGGTVLDPFGGAGTTGLVADRLKRDAILIELNPEYAEIARRRIEGDAGMFATVSAEDAA